MKKIIFIILLLISVQGYSQTAVFEISGDKIACKVYNDKDSLLAESDEDGGIYYEGRITKVKFIENPILSESKGHTFTIDETPFEFIKKENINSLFGKSMNEANLKNAIDLIPESEIKINNRIYNFTIRIKKKVELKPEDVEKKVEVSYLNDDTVFTFKNKDTHTFKCGIKYPDYISLDNVRIEIDNRTQKIIFYKDKDSLEYTVDPKVISDTDLTNVYLIFDATYNDQKIKGIKRHIATVTKEIKPFPFVASAIVLGLVVATFLIIYIIKRRKWSKAKVFEDIKNQIRIKVLCENQPQIGDIANIVGIIETADGVIYETLKKNKFGKITVESIFTRIYCLDGKSFDVDSNIQTDENTSPTFNIISSNSIGIQLHRGMIAKPDGEYVTKNNYVIHISNGEIESILLRVYDKFNKCFDIEVKSSDPQVGDKVKTPCMGNRIELNDDTIYKIVNKRITEIILPIITLEAYKDLLNQLEQIKQANFTLESKKKALEKEKDELKKTLDVTQKSLEQRQAELAQVKIDKEAAEEKLQNVNKAIEEAKIAARRKGESLAEKKYKQLISENYITLDKYNESVKSLKSQKEEVTKAKEKAESKVKIKDTEICGLETQIEQLKKDSQEQNDALIRQKAANAKLKDAAKKKNMHYVLQIQDVLCEISETFKDVYKDITSQEIRDGLISPMLRGVSGLSTGILSWAEDFSVKVIEESEGFFGDDFLIMSESEVKNILGKKFISNIVKSDSFSKFVRLYQLSTVPFIRKQLVDAHMNVAVLNILYYKMYALVTDFGYTIICPNLFEEQYSESKYQWFNSTNLFSVINLPESEKMAIKEKGPETIIDINQIGFSSIWANRKATAVTPDF